MHRTLATLAVLVAVVAVPLGATAAAAAPVDAVTIKQCEYGGGHLDFDSHSNTVCIGGEFDGSLVDW
ncbi:hypothetical protein ACFZAT_08550 [Streptomyces sp. NPDC008163]|uniref:hypothetical protein n=1 Tax=Streptomyces sp. NPDC008163 TaxID=3364818 RepID=UPI0036F0B90A